MLGLGMIGREARGAKVRLVREGDTMECVAIGRGEMPKCGF
jgi:hypothetical protein